MKKSSALLGVIAVYSPKRTFDPLFLSNYVTSNLLDQIKCTPGVGDAVLWGPQDYAMRAWVRTDQLTGLNLTTADVINAIQTQNIQAAVGRVFTYPNVVELRRPTTRAAPAVSPPATRRPSQQRTLVEASLRRCPPSPVRKA